MYAFVSFLIQIIISDILNPFSSKILTETQIQNTEKDPQVTP